MNKLVVLVACLAGLVHSLEAAPSWYPWAVPQHVPVVLPSGYLADTQEVAALKAAHAVHVANTPGVAAGPWSLPLPGWNSWYGPAPWYHGPWHGPAPYPLWHGPQHIPVVLPTGYLADTPEVAALKAAHATAHAQAPQ